ncbi:class I SAM-dependent methyltransferase [Rhodococcus spelaei]|uniref:Class I SAM-dependent methyltransferase n=1 Tax=Rhodococcus spelaei TaxID=2546320 RepID=A0A541B217_9NOCA|nr:class I SAM-dependent methyltransferase [Rhodococcus spelaei]TQF66345.1 class I SAM-dependent methyltransferase [Rhodococcus spelaei]
MTQHSRHDTRQHHEHGHGRGHGHGHGHHDEVGLAELLDLDAEVLGSYLDDMAEWVGQHALDQPRSIADIGAGTGRGSLALARQFPAAEVIAIDRSAAMLDRIRVSADEEGVADRMRVVQADLDVGWPAVGAVDVAWAASSLHEVADPDRLLGDLHDALNPGGLLVVVEMDGLPRFLPDDLGRGRPGLELRCHELLNRANWNAHPDWRPHLERAGFEIAEQRSITVDANPVPPNAGRYARAYLSRIHEFLDGQLPAEDLDTLDHLLTDDNPDSLLRRPDLTVRGSRTAWAARRT